MPVESNTVEYTYTGDGVSMVFPFPSLFLSNTDILVGVNGVLQVSGYTVSGTGNPTGGSVTFDAAPAAAAKVVLLRKPPINQLIDFVSGQTVLEGVLDRGLDKLTMIAQYLTRAQERSVQVSELSGLNGPTLGDPVAGRALVWSADGNITNSATNPDTAQADLDALEALEAQDRADINARTTAPSAATVLGYDGSGSPMLIPLNQMTTGSDHFDAEGSLAGRSAYDSSSPPFKYLVNDVNPMVFYQRSGAAGNWLGPFQWSVTEKQIRDASGKVYAWDFATLKDAIDYAAPLGLHLELGGSNRAYAITTPINAVTPKDKRFIISSDGATIDATNVTGQGGAAGSVTAMTLGGTVGTPVALTASPAKGDTSVTAASALSGAAIGDIVQIVSTDLWNVTRTSYVKGEMARIKGIAGAVYTLDAPLFDGYSSATTTIALVNAPMITVDGLIMTGNSNQIGLNVQNGRMVDVERNRVKGFRYSSINATTSVGVRIRQNTTSDSYYVGTGTSYGIGVASCQDFEVSNNNCTEARHCISHGGTFPFRRGSVRKNYCEVHASSTTLAIDTHGNGEFITIEDNEATGIIVSSKSTSIRKNRVRANPAMNTAAVQVYVEHNVDGVDISDNYIENLQTGGSSVGVLIGLDRSLGLSPASIALTGLRINGNIIRTTKSGISIQPQNAGSTNCSIGPVELYGNDVAVTGSGSAALLYANAAAAAFTIGDIMSRGNKFKSAAGAAVSAATNITFGTQRHSQDRIQSNSTSNYAANFRGVDVVLQDCVLDGWVNGVSTKARSVRFLNTGKAIIRGSDVKNMLYIELEAAGPTLFVDQDNSYTNCNADPVLNTATARHAIQQLRDGTIVTHGNAAPATLTWIAGDEVRRKTPVSAAPNGWRCTAGGTPGTWVAEANLA